MLNLVDGKVFKATVHQAEHGHITPEGEFETAQESLTEFRFKPDAGYRLKSVSMNGRDVTGEIENDVYTLHNIQSDYEISVVFAPLSAADMKKIASAAAGCSGKALNEEEKISILDAKQHLMLCRKHHRKKFRGIEEKAERSNLPAPGADRSERQPAAERSVSASG